jgi:hypothetical protein
MWPITGNGSSSAEVAPAPSEHRPDRNQVEPNIERRRDAKRDVMKLNIDMCRPAGCAGQPAILSLRVRETSLGGSDCEGYVVCP